MPSKVIVIGAGVTGLTTALSLLRAGFQIIVVARELPEHRSINYTSPWAGAIYRPWPDIDPQSKYEADLARLTYETFKQISTEDPSGGVKLIEGYDYFRHPSKAYTSLEGRYSQIDGFRVLENSELPDGIKFGTTYRTWCLNPPVYLNWLKRQLIFGGVQFVQYNLANILEVFPVVKEPETTIVINCSGFGFSDPAMFPIRGQTVLVLNPFNKVISQQDVDGSWIYIIPRPLDGGTYIGGTRQENDWNPFVDVPTREKLLERASKVAPQLISNELPPNDGGFKVIGDIVGRRPSRHGGVRIEAEKAGNVKIVHAYGVGHLGYELSWGVANEVLKLVA